MLYPKIFISKAKYITISQALKFAEIILLMALPSNICEAKISWGPDKIPNQAVIIIPFNFSLTDLALKWILMHDEVSVVIPGAKNSSQVQTNVHASELEDISSLMPKINLVYDEFIKPAVQNRW